MPNSDQNNKVAFSNDCHHCLYHRFFLCQSVWNLNLLNVAGIQTFVDWFFNYLSRMYLAGALLSCSKVGNLLQDETVSHMVKEQ
jgi:hypothetical protein